MKIIASTFFCFACLIGLANAQEKAKNILLLNAAGNTITLGSPVAVTNNTILLPGTLGLQGGLMYLSSVAGSVGTSTWLNPGTNGFVLTLSGGLPTWANPASVDWQLIGNAGTTPGVGVGQNYLGTSDAQNLIFATSATERMRILSTGNIAINSVTAPQLFTIGGDIGIVGVGSKVTASGTANELIMEETTDTYGTSRLRMQDRNGSNGALFEQIENAGNPGVDLVDFGFKPGTKVQSNIRLEARTADLRGTPNITSATASEFQFLFGSTTTPQYVLSIGQGATLLEAGNFGIGYSAGSGTFPVASPLEKLDVHTGNIILSNTGTAGVSGTAGLLKFQGTRDGISSFAAGAQASNTFNYVLPTAVPTAGQVLAINTISGATPYAVTLNWTTPGTTSVLYNTTSTQNTASIAATNYLYDIAYAATASAQNALGARITSTNTSAGANNNATGLTISATATSTGTATGLNVTATGGSNDYAALFTGNVGIGQATPTSPLHVAAGATATGGYGLGSNFNQTITAAANNDSLYGVSITPTFTNGAFTGLNNFALRVLYSGTLANGTAIRGKASGNGGANSEVIGVWGLATNATQASNTNAGTGMRAEGNSTTTDANSNIGLQIVNGEFVVGRQASNAANDNTSGNNILAEDDNNGVTDQGPSGVVDVTVNAAAATSVSSGTLVVDNRYAKTTSIVLLTPMNGGTSAPNANESVSTRITARASGTFTIEVRRTNPTAAAGGTNGTIRVGFLIVNPGK